MSDSPAAGGFGHDPADSLGWARIILPLAFRAFGTPRRVVDLGGGPGYWCRACGELGVERAICFDHPDTAGALAIPRRDFRGFRLDRRMPAPVRADMALCIEFAEHMPPRSGAAVAGFLAASAPVVLFSAAQPFQYGVGHINGRWPHFWEARFAEHGFVQVDGFRGALLGRGEVAWWLQQNLFAYARRDIAESLDPASLAPPPAPRQFVLVHHESLPQREDPPDGMAAARAAGEGVVDAVRAIVRSSPVKRTKPRRRADGAICSGLLPSNTPWA